MKKIFLILLISFTSLVSCKKKFEGLLEDPTLPGLSAATADLYMNTVQINIPNFFTSYDAVGNTTGLSDFAAQFTRMEGLITGSTYPDVYDPPSYDILWNTSYLNIFKNVNAMFELINKEEDESLKKYNHLGIGKVLKAYMMLTLVDFFGDVPFSEAGLGSENTNPKTDAGADIYAGAIAMLDEAIDDFNKNSSIKPTVDIFYNGNMAKWKTLAKTLKLKAYLQMRLVDQTVKGKIDALLAEGDLIDQQSEDFQYQFGTKSAAPDSRHPKFAFNYTSTGANDYIGNQIMWMMYSEKVMVDPRIRYYFYRQTTDIVAAIPDQTTFTFTIPCYTRSKPAQYTDKMPFCLVSNGYIGRDHGNNEGIPPDRQYRTTYGVYPMGGKFDNDDNVPVTPDDGGKGAGISPIWLSSFTDFAKAEAALTLGTAGDPRALLESGIRKSFAKVISFPATIGVTVPSDKVPTQSDMDDYVDIVLADYDAASTVSAKLDVLMKEYYLASYGNGIEPYNNYRRTGKPSNLQYMVNPSPGSFIRSAYYPAVFANLNQNAVQKSGTGDKVFWDNNPDDFIK